MPGQGNLFLNLEGTYTQSGTQRHLAFTDSSSEAAGSGTQVARNTGSTANWTKGARTVSIESSGQTHVNGRSFNVTSSRTLSGTRCPTGTSTLTRDNRTVTLTLDGSAEALFTDPAGATQAVGVACGF